LALIFKQYEKNLNPLTIYWNMQKGIDINRWRVTILKKRSALYAIGYKIPLLHL
jgi:hypothetical protein